MSWIALGLLAGLTTTLAGMGGGTLLVLGLALLHDPLDALAMSTPALMVGNLHRVALYRRQVQWSEARALAAGGFAAALLGGLLVSAMPEWLIQGSMVLMALLALADQMGLALRPPAGATLPVAALAGLVSATSGGGGLIAGPYLLARGLSGVPYVATGAIGAAAIHLGKLAAYSSTGVSDGHTLLRGLALAALIAAGNVAGERARPWLGQDRQRSLQIGVMVACVGVALAGL